MAKVIDYLLSGEPYVEYVARIELLGESPDDSAVLEARANMIADPRILSLIRELGGWQNEVVTTHKKASLLLHKLCFLADIGLTAQDEPLREPLQAILSNRDENGIVCVRVNIPKHFGGTGLNTWGWALCDAPVVLYALIKLGVDEPSLHRAVVSLMNRAQENGWPCVVSPELGTFRGPGRKCDPCPYATLQMLKLLSLSDEGRNCTQSRLGAEALLSLWQNSLSAHPYLFYMGTDFRKLKAPLLWYDLLSVTDVLSRFEWLRDDPRFLDMLRVLSGKADENGLYTPDSVYLSCREFDFGQKKKPSCYLTLAILRIFKRAGFNAAL